MKRSAVLVLLVVLAGASAATASRSGPAGPAPVCVPGQLPREGNPIASRDGRVLAWSRSRYPRNTYRVFTSRPDGSGVEQVSVPGRGGDVPIALAPDGSELLIRRMSLKSDEPSRAILASTQGSTGRFVSDVEATEIGRRWRAREWSPDGAFRVVADGFDGLWVAAAEGGMRRRISAMSSYDATWSPVGDLIAFSSTDATGADSDLYVIRPDGTGLRPLTKDGLGAWDPSWSPDGSRLAFVIDHSNYHEGAAIGVMRPDGSGRRMLTRAQEGPDKRSSVSASWIDTSTLVFVTYQRKEGPLKVVDVHTIGVDGRGERRVTYQCHLGTTKDDLLRGSLLGDTMRTFAGDDEVRPGPGADDVDAGAGNDLVRSRDGARDVIQCGPGRDRVLADRRDVIRGCERVVRR